MTGRRQVRQLVAFATISVLAAVYAAVRLFGWADLLSPPYQVSADFSASGGIYPGADVDLLGTRIGKVTAVTPGAAGGTHVVMAIDHDARVPRTVSATVADKSAIGEQYVELEPVAGADDGLLASGDVIPRRRTAIPIPTEKLLANINGLAASVPLRDLHTVLDESATALAGVTPDLRHLLDASDRLTASTQASSHDLVRLIKSARRVLDTQSDLVPTTRVALVQSARVIGRVRGLDGSFVRLFRDGAGAGRETTRLLTGIAPILPPLLTNLNTMTALAADRIPALRRSLVLFPWALQYGASSIRYCDDYDAVTGRPIQATCHYDAQGRPIYSTHFAFQLPELPGAAPYLPCTQGYGGTRHYEPDGTAVGGGPREQRDPAPNLAAGCTAPPTDPKTPNVRGAQNVH